MTPRILPGKLSQPIDSIIIRATKHGICVYTWCNLKFLFLSTKWQFIVLDTHARFCITLIINWNYLLVHKMFLCRNGHMSISFLTRLTYWSALLHFCKNSKRVYWSFFANIFSVSGSLFPIYIWGHNSWKYISTVFTNHHDPFLKLVYTLMASKVMAQPYVLHFLNGKKISTLLQKIVFFEEILQKIVNIIVTLYFLQQLMSAHWFGG